MHSAPLYVLLPDEQTFKCVSNDTDLQWFEMIDVQDEAHHAWDEQGSRYLLVWDDGRHAVEARLVSTDDLAGFLKAIDDFLAIPGIDALHARHIMTATEVRYLRARLGKRADRPGSA
ncbi:MAG: hypothetical protein AMXMBFR58_20230 [Phycisphaerae bacterium]|nr:hypothetical protein [Phycisphaerales bacterium]